MIGIRDEGPESPSRRQFMFNTTGVAISGLFTAASTSGNIIRQHNQELNEPPLINPVKLVIDRFRYKINTTLTNLPTPEMQRYDLDCELTSLSNALNYWGVNCSVDELIEALHTSTNPDYGIHPNLTDKPRTDRSRCGKLPPHPYGIYPKPLAEMLIHNGIHVSYHDHHMSQLSPVKYKEWIATMINNQIPVVFWHQLHPSTEIATYKKVPVAKFSHTGLITGCGTDNFEYIDPYNGRLMYKPCDHVYREAAVQGFNLLAITRTNDSTINNICTILESK